MQSKAAPSLRALALSVALLSAAQAQTAPAGPAATPAAPSPVAPATAPAQVAPLQTAPAAPSAPTPAVTPAPATGAVLSFSEFFRPLQQYPSLIQAKLALEAARTQQSAANFPLSASVSASTTGNYNIDPPPTICATTPLAALNAACAPVPSSVQTLNAALRASPLNVGDVGARREQARLGVVQAELAYRSALANLQGQAVLAAQRLRLAQSSAKLAQQALATAQLAQQAIQNRFNGGGATQNEVAQAQLTLAQAQNASQQAQETLQVARAALSDLTGQSEAPNLPEVTRPKSGQSANVVQAQLAAQRAQSTYEQTKWNALPTVQANYTHFFNDTTGIGAAIDSRSLSPAATLVYAPRTPPANRVHDQVTLALNVDASAATFAGPQVAQSGVEQAQLGVQAAQRQAQLQLDSLDAALAQAQRARTLAQQALSLAQQQQKDAESRRDLGLASPIEAAQAGVATYQAQLAAAQATLNASEAALKFYPFFAQPLDAQP